MQYDILLTKQPANGYLARPVLMPELVVSGENEVEALARVQAEIIKAATHSRIVQINVPNDADASVDPWLRFSGQWGDEAEWEQFSEDIKAFRCEIDQQIQSTDE